MDNFGYRNWSSSESESSPSQSYARRGGGGSKPAADDVYDFDISNDDSDQSPPMTKKYGATDRLSGRDSVSSQRSSQNLYLSKEDRMKDILEKSRKQENEKLDRQAKLEASKPSVSESWKSDWADIMQGINSPDNTSAINNDESKPSKQAFKSPGSVYEGDSSFGDSSFGDSLDISAADLEVGAIAARKAKEKTSDRRRRMSINSDVAAQLTAGPPSKISSSPEVHGRSKHNTHGVGVFSSALSSIYKSGDDRGVLYSSVEKSDGDLYKMLSSNKLNKRSSSGDSDSSDSGDSDEAVENAKKDDDDYDDDFEDQEPSAVETVKPSNYEEDISRRNSLEEIKQRWLSVDSSKLFEVPTAQVTETNVDNSQSSRSDEDSSSDNEQDDDNNDDEKQDTMTNVVADDRVITRESDDKNAKSNVEVAVDNASDKDADEKNTFSIGNSDSMVNASMTEQHDSELVADYSKDRSISPAPPPVNTSTVFSNSNDETEVEVNQVTDAVTKSVDVFDDLRANNTHSIISDAVVVESKAKETSARDISTTQKSLSNSNSVIHIQGNRSALTHSGYGASRYEDRNDISILDGDELKEGGSTDSSNVLPKQSVDVKFNASAVFLPVQPPDPINIIGVEKKRELYPADGSDVDDSEDYEDVGRNRRSKSAVISRGSRTNTIRPATAGSQRNTQNMPHGTKPRNVQAVATLAKVNQRLKEKGVSPVSAPARREQALDSKLVSKLELGTAKLAKRFEELEHEVKVTLKTNKADIENVIRANLEKHRASNKPRNSSKPSRSLVDASPPTRMRQSKSNVKTHNDHHAEKADGEELTEDSAVLSWKVGNRSASFDKSAITLAADHTIKQLKTKGELLHNKEIEIKQREEAVQLRESLARAALLEAYDNTSAKDTVVMTKTELDRMTNKEVQLQQEIDQMKATILELKQMQLMAPPPARFMDRLKKFKSTESDEKEEMVSIKKSEYDYLLSEISNLEKLVYGYQKENEKLVQEQKQRQLESNYSKATYFDQTEHLNKELNKLRNATHVISDNAHTSTGSVTGDVNIIRKSADALRAELEIDGTIRALRERLGDAEAGAGVREKELTITIEKLRADYRQLVTEMNNKNNNSKQLQVQKEHTIEDIKAVHQSEVKELKTKLAWFSENQELIEQSESARNMLNEKVNLLKKELRRRGMDLKAINALLAVADPHNTVSDVHDHVESSNNVTSGSGNITGSSKAKYGSRNPGDIKKIKELEKTISELQESILKRNPDSVASLIRAAKTSDSVQLERKKEKEDIEQLKIELVDAKEGYVLTHSPNHLLTHSPNHQVTNDVYVVSVKSTRRSRYNMRQKSMNYPLNHLFQRSPRHQVVWIPKILRP